MGRGRCRCRCGRTVPCEYCVGGVGPEAFLVGLAGFLNGTDPKCTNCPAINDDYVAEMGGPGCATYACQSSPCCRWGYLHYDPGSTFLCTEATRLCIGVGLYRFVSLGTYRMRVAVDRVRGGGFGWTSRTYFVQDFDELPDCRNFDEEEIPFHSEYVPSLPSVCDGTLATCRLTAL